MRELYCTDRAGISQEKILAMCEELLKQYPNVKKVLIVPPDYTRCHSYGGVLTQILYSRLKGRGAEVKVMPALGTHMPMNNKEKRWFFGGVVPDRDILIHHWQTDTAVLGVIPKELVEKISEGLYADEIEVEVNHLLVDGSFDLILSVGQVVPHEVVGMSNYSKNLFVGLGGRAMINKSHMLSAIYGIENVLGIRDCPTRLIYDYAQQRFIDGKVPVVFLQTVTTRDSGNLQLNGLYMGDSRVPFEMACELAQELNIVHVERRAKKVVAYLEPDEFKTTWVGNKGIYRTRMMVADGGDLVLLAPGIRAFGENAEIDSMIRRFGYRGRSYVLDLFNKGVFGEDKIMSAAHLIQGSSDGRFAITYCTNPEQMSKEEIESVGYQWADYGDASERYGLQTLKEGWNTLPTGEEIYFISAPALGLWKCDN